MKKIFLWSLLAFVLNGCYKHPENNKQDFSIQDSKVAILCEGNFNWENARLDIWNSQTGEYFDRVFEQANLSALGDVLQSGFHLNNSLYLVVNNSGKLVKVNDEKFTIEVQNTDLISPRYMAEANGRLYVTDLMNNGVMVLDTQHLGRLGFIRNLDSQKTSFQGWTEQVVHWNNYIAVASVSGDVLLIDPVNIEAVKRIKTAAGCKYLSVSKEGSLWGISSLDGSSSVFNINTNLSIEKSIDLPEGFNLNQLAYLPDLDCFFTLVDGSLMKFESNTTSFDDWTKIDIAEAVNLYGLGVDPQKNTIFVTDAKDYVSKGQVIVLDSSGTETNRLSTGVIPNGIVILD